MRDRYLTSRVGSLLDPLGARPRSPAGAPVSDSLDELARRAASGETDALGLLFDRLIEPLYRYVASRVDVQEDAEDLTQLVFERLVAALPRYEHRDGSFHVWAFRIARNAVVDHQRGRHRERQVTPTAWADATSSLDPESAAVHDEERRQLRVALGRLTPEQHEAVVLRYISGLSAEDAGAVMDRSPGTVRALTFRGIASLRRHLRADGGP